VPRDARYFSQTSFRVDDDLIWHFFDTRGGVSTFGYPISRTFTLLGCATQFFQRHVLQRCQEGPARLLNLLDPDVMPVRRVNGAVYPAHDPAVAGAAPAPQSTDYSLAVLEYLVEAVPSTFDGMPVDFFALYMETVPPGPAVFAPSALSNLEIWGFPTSAATTDPGDPNVVYQRFQRGIFQHRATTGITEAVLLGDFFQRLITGRELPPDLEAEARAAGSRFLRQYCPGQPRALCRPAELGGTDLTAAFEPQ
jgi:hypothetical protein